MTVTVRFAPSPTGFLHIGGARTALFNWLFAKHHKGTFRLRIEDTDRARSTPEAMAAILDGLKWLALDWDGEVVYQSRNQARHAEVARQLLAAGHAYYCYCTPAELEAMRLKALGEGRSLRYDGTWRDRDPKTAPQGVKPVIRLKAAQGGDTVVDDLAQGAVTVSNQQLDDLIILRADGTPTYNFSVVVDDHDMAISHVIRGDDHLTNSFRQTQIYKALDWTIPRFAHLPLLHGPDGAKMSKRHGALAVQEYQKMGYLPAALRNYLLRLGWSHGDDEIIATEQAIQWFDLDAVGRAAARFDFVKLANLNGHYIRQTPDDELAALALPFVEDKLGQAFDAAQRERFLKAIPDLKPRAKTLVELAERARFYVAKRPIPVEAEARKLLDDPARARLKDLHAALDLLVDGPQWNAPHLERFVKEYCETAHLKLGDVAQPLRAALTGSRASPGIFEVMAVLGRAESLARLADAVEFRASTSES
ncbi:MAG: glutamate--tRNA ligase [Alphaproteobacteria bacterium]|nr:glutamate--tRNA ligase [Alphaproteobacteria bacterium]